MSYAGGLLTQKSVLLGKIESTYGTDPSPSSSTDAIEIFSFDPKISKENIVRNPLRTSLSPLPVRYSLKQQEFSFETELKGSGTAGTAPAIGKLFVACGMVEVATPGSSVIYTPGNPTSSITLYGYKDGALFKMTGSMGTWELTCQAGKLPRIKWTFKGLYNIITDVAIPASPTFESTIAAVLESTNTQINSFTSAIIREFSLDIANDIALRPNINSAGAVVGQRISSRNPKGKITMEAELRSVNDIAASFDAATLVTFSSVIGTVAGNICTIGATSKAQISDMNAKDDNGIFCYDLDVMFSGSDDEFNLKFT